MDDISIIGVVASNASDVKVGSIESDMPLSMLDSDTATLDRVGVGSGVSVSERKKREVSSTLVAATLDDVREGNSEINT